MPYEGDVLTACGLVRFAFSSTYIVAVSGDGPNVCGHLLVHSTAGGGLYFHVIGDPDGKYLGKMRGYPRYMNDTNYRRYLKENRKQELRRRPVKLKNPQAAADYVESVLAEQWTWGVLPNNCVAFVESVIKSGGGDWSSFTNCPAVATADTVTERLQQFFSNMDAGIRRLYGVPY